MEVIFDKFAYFGVSRLGVWYLPGRFIADFGHFGAKPFTGVGPIDARRKVLLEGALVLPLALVYFLPLPLRTSREPLRSGRRSNLGGGVRVQNTGTLSNRSQRDELRQNEWIDLPFVGLNPHSGLLACTTADTPTLLPKVSDFSIWFHEDVYLLALPVGDGRVGRIWSVARALPLSTEVGQGH